ncbi:dynactin subunit 6-like [Gigantopelta aegis]|uniref:dynactin subunit 6-like n=1 Tax=Gigantopelta aegis TaxID=1735272 RepID=UPI001B88A15A|nr:dynactin subunit 6-like [Gigantopelta aegis]
MAATSRLPKSVKIAPGAIVCEESELVGDITIGTRTVIHPKAKIIAEAGPIVIGEGNIIEEMVVILNRLPEDMKGSGDKHQVLVIGNNNVFEVGAQVLAMKIGDQNYVESKAMIGPRVELTSGCIIGASCSVVGDEKLYENTIITGANCKRRIQREKPPAQTLQIDFLSKILPNYHYTLKVTQTSRQPASSPVTPK